MLGYEPKAQSPAQGKLSAQHKRELILWLQDKERSSGKVPLEEMERREQLEQLRGQKVGGRLKQPGGVTQKEAKAHWRGVQKFRNIWCRLRESSKQRLCDGSNKERSLDTIGGGAAGFFTTRAT